MATNIKIYRTQLTPARNALLDDIEGYLSAIENPTATYRGDDELIYSSDNFQYIRPELDITIRINLPLDNNNIFDSIGNYLRVEQSQGGGDTAIWYYMITDSRWVAQSTLELTCSMDTVNTFSYFVLNRDNWNDKTNIVRQHEKPVYFINNEVVNKVDKYGEGITPSVLYKIEDTKIEELYSLNTKEWYLVYETTNPALGESVVTSDTSNIPSENTLNCYLYPSEKIVATFTNNINQASEPITSFDKTGLFGITEGELEFESEKVVCTIDNITAECVINGNTGEIIYLNGTRGYKDLRGRVAIGDTFELNGLTYRCNEIVWLVNEAEIATLNGVQKEIMTQIPFGIFENANGLRTSAFYLESVGNVSVNKFVIPSRDYIEVPGEAYEWYAFRLRTVETDNTMSTSLERNPLVYNMDTFEYLFTETDNIRYLPNYNNFNAIPKPEELLLGEVYEPFVPENITYIDSILNLDRTKSTLIKIITLPYCPTKIETVKQNGINYVLFDEEIFEVESYGDSNEYRRIKYKDIKKTFKFGKKLSSVIKENTYNPEYKEFFSKPKLTLKNINNEPKLKQSSFYSEYFVYDNVSKLIRREDIIPSTGYLNYTPYYQPTNTISSAMMYKFDIDGTYEEIGNWDTVLISDRNNETPIFNNDYLNYLRYGYSTESTNLEASAGAQRTAGTLGGLAAIATGVLLGAKAGVPGMVIGGIIGLISYVGTAITTETNIANANRSLEQKLEQLRNTNATTNSGASSVDLMTSYTDNRLHLMTYEVPNLLKDALWDRFYYCGYSHPVQDIPDLHNRLCFNFVQCTPSFKNESTSRYNYYMTDIKARFEAGITIYHDISPILADREEIMYDWKQQYENWYLSKNNIERTQIKSIPTIPSLNDGLRYDITFDNPYILSTNKRGNYIKREYAISKDSYLKNIWEYPAESYSPITDIYFVDHQREPIILKDRVLYLIEDGFKLKMNLYNTNIKLSTDYSDIIKPSTIRLESPAIIREQNNLTINTNIPLGLDYYVQMKMIINDEIVEYPFSNSIGGYSSQTSYNVQQDLENAGYDYSKLQYIMARIIRRNGSQVSPWTIN